MAATLLLAVEARLLKINSDVGTRVLVVMVHLDGPLCVLKMS